MNNRINSKVLKVAYRNWGRVKKDDKRLSNRKVRVVMDRALAAEKKSALIEEGWKDAC